MYILCVKDSQGAGDLEGEETECHEVTGQIYLSVLRHVATLNKPLCFPPFLSWRTAVLWKDGRSCLEEAPEIWFLP